MATTATAKTSTTGYYEFSGTLPNKSGRHLLYKVWQRNDSPEAFYSCSDVVFGQGAQTAGTPKSPTEKQLDAGASQSTVSHHGHGGDTPGEQNPAKDDAVALNAENTAAATDGDSGIAPTLAGLTAAGITAACFVFFRRRRT